MQTLKGLFWMVQFRSLAVITDIEATKVARRMSWDDNMMDSWIVRTKEIFEKCLLNSTALIHV